MTKIRTLNDYTLELATSQRITPDPERDGIDHINVDREIAKTRLGQQLAINYKAPFKHPVLGPFHSIEAYWRFIVSKGEMDSLRWLSAQRPISGAERASLPNHRVPDFFAHMTDAIYHRLRQDDNLVSEFMQNDLPFNCYFLFQGERGPVAIHSEALNFQIGALNYLHDVFLGHQPYQEPDYSALEAFLARP